MNAEEKEKPKRYKLPRWLKLAMGDYGNLRQAYILNGKLYATDGHMLLIFGGYEGLPDGPIPKPAVEFITRKLLEFTATDKRVCVQTGYQHETVEFERPTLQPPSFEKVARRVENTGPCVRIVLSPDVLLNAVRASMWETGAGSSVVHLDIPVEYLETGMSEKPWNVTCNYSKAERILFMPCNLDPEDADRNKAVLRQAKDEGTKEGAQ